MANCSHRHDALIARTGTMRRNRACSWCNHAVRRGDIRPTKLGYTHSLVSSRHTRRLTCRARLPAPPSPRPSRRAPSGPHRARPGPEQPDLPGCLGRLHGRHRPPRRLRPRCCLRWLRCPRWHLARDRRRCSWRSGGGRSRAAGACLLRSAARLLPSPSRRLGRCAIVFGLRGSPRRCGRRRSLFCYGRSRRQLRPVFLPRAPRWCARRRCCAWYRGPSGCSGCSRWLGAERSTIFHRAAAGLATSLRRRACQSRLQRVRAVSSSIGSIG